MLAHPHETVVDFAARVLRQAAEYPHPGSYIAAWHAALSHAHDTFAERRDTLSHEDHLAELRARIDALTEIDQKTQARVGLLEAEVDVLREQHRPAARHA